MAKQNEKSESTPVFASNPLAPRSAEVKARHKEILSQIQQEHRNVQIYVKKKYRDNPEPILVDKG